MCLIKIIIIILICVFFAEPVLAEPITFPYTNSFDSPNFSWWRNPSNTGANMEHITGSACYGGIGGCVKLTPPTTSGTSQTLVGLGSYELPPNTRRLNIRVLVKIGNQYEETGRQFDGRPMPAQNKMFIVWREGASERGMTIFEQCGDGSPQTFYTWGACEDNTCEYYGSTGDMRWWPNANDRFKSTSYPDQWVCVEVEYDLDNLRARTYIWTRDGVNNGLHKEKAYSSGVGRWTQIQVIGGFFNGYHVADPNAYLIFDNLAISNTFIGPPEGFLSGADTTPPSTPTGLTATAISSSQINLSWAASTDNVAVTGYRIFRCQGAGCTPTTQIATSTTTSYSDTGLSPSTTYVYRVAAFDAAGNVSGQSTSASATTQADTTSPSVPASLTATAISSSQINLSWTASTDNVGVTGYRVERCQGSTCTNFTQIATPTGNSYSDTGLSANTTYRYRVRAVDAAGNLSPYSSIVSATTQAPPDTTPPTAPTNLTATAVSSSQVNLSWTASTDNVGVTGYRVERCQGLTCTNFTQIAAPTGTSYSDTGLSANTTYRYRVRAVDAAGNLSSYSSIVSATTQAPPDTTPPAPPVGLRVE